MFAPWCTESFFAYAEFHLTRYALVIYRDRMRTILTAVEDFGEQVLSATFSISQTPLMADRVPPELFEHIIHCLTLHLRWELFTKEHRQILGKWSLVSRHWAKHCRPFIFHTLTICSKEDAQMLLQLSSSFVDGCYPLGYYVTMLFLRQRLPSPPWTHFIYLSVAASLMTNIRKIDVTIEPETSSFQATEFRSTQSGLPKSYPHRWSGLAGIELTLSNFRFRAFRDIIIALDSINTNEISLRGLSWEIEDNDSQTPPDVPASVFATRWNHNTILMTLTITACTAAWPFMWYILTARPSARSTGPCSRVPVFVEASKILALVNIARILWDDCKCATCCGEPADNVSHCFEFYSCE